MMYFGTLSCYGEEQGLEVVILSGDRDTFQLATDKVTIRIPHTKAGKTETDEYNKEKIIEKYGIEPKQLIDVKGLQGDTSDNIPGVPGIGEKTALKLIQEYDSIENLYEKVENNEDNLKGKQREKIAENKELAVMSKILGTINWSVPIEHNLDVIKVADYIIDLGPEGGIGGGLVVAEGTPEEVSKEQRSYTGQFLKKIL